MTLDETLLVSLNEAGPVGGSRQKLAFTDDTTKTAVRLDIERRDEFSCLLWEVRLDRPERVELAAWARSSAERVTGLLEALQVLEVDAAQGTAVLRSESPVIRNEDRYYYELLLKQPGTAELRRYKAWMTQSSRQQLPFTLTNEALGKLVVDLAS